MSEGTMKPFDYYSKVGVPYTTKKQFLDPLIDKINDMPLTVAQRDAKVREAYQKADKLLQESREAYWKAENALRDEFFADCRQELGYAAHLSEAAIESLESMAWDRGHSNGYPEVYSELSALADLAIEIATNPRVTK